MKRNYGLLLLVALLGILPMQAQSPRTIHGLTFYCDRENIYVINNKYEDYEDDTRRRRDSDNNNHFLFRCKISGMIDLDYYMYKRNGIVNW